MAGVTDEVADRVPDHLLMKENESAPTGVARLDWAMGLSLSTYSRDSFFPSSPFFSEERVEEEDKAGEGGGEATSEGSEHSDLPNVILYNNLTPSTRRFAPRPPCRFVRVAFCKQKEIIEGAGRALMCKDSVADCELVSLDES